jgi:hypothetical protein
VKEGIVVGLAQRPAIAYGSKEKNQELLKDQDVGSGEGTEVFGLAQEIRNHGPCKHLSPFHSRKEATGGFQYSSGATLTKPPTHPETGLQDGLPPAVESFLREVAGDDMRVHGLGQDINLIPPLPHLLAAAKVFQAHFESTEALRSALCDVIEETDDSQLALGAITVMKKLGVSRIARMRLVAPVLRILQSFPPNGDLYHGALVLLSYCDQTEPLSADEKDAIVERCRSGELVDLGKFSVVGRLMAKQWRR